MSKKIFVGMGSALLLTTSLLAYNTGCPMQGTGGQNQNSMQQNRMYQQCQKNMNKMRLQRGHSFIFKVMQLKLTKEQRTQIQGIVQKNMQSMPRPSLAFTDTGFNKALFIKLQKEKRANMIERKADMIEKIYKLLDSAQKKELKTLMQNNMRMNKRAMMMQ